MNAFLGLLKLDAIEIIQFAELLIPEVSQEIIETYLSYISGNQSIGLLVAGILMIVTTASAAYRALIRIMAKIYELPPAKGVRHMVTSVIFPFGLLITIYLSIGVILTGDWFMDWLSVKLSIELFANVWKDVRFLLLFLVFFLFVLLISYSTVPRDTQKMPILIGSIISALALVVSSVLFSQLISLSTRYSLVYGSLFSIVAMLVWLYLCSNILLFGNILSSVWYKEYGKLRKESGER